MELHSIWCKRLVQVSWLCVMGFRCVNCQLRQNDMMWTVCQYWQHSLYTQSHTVCLKPMTHNPVRCALCDILYKRLRNSLTYLLTYLLCIMICQLSCTALNMWLVDYHWPVSCHCIIGCVSCVWGCVTLRVCACERHLGCVYMSVVGDTLVGRGVLARSRVCTCV